MGSHIYDLADIHKSKESGKLGVFENFIRVLIILSLGLLHIKLKR